MAAITYRPPSTTAGNVEVRAGTDLWVFEPGVPQEVPQELRANLLAALQGAFPALVSPQPAIVTTGGAAGAQTYYVVAVNANGDTLPSAVRSTTTGPTTLDATHYNTLNWAAAAGATQYKVIRSAGGPSQGIIATVNAPALFFVDNGVAASPYTAAGAAVSSASAVVTNSEM